MPKMQIPLVLLNSLSLQKQEGSTSSHETCNTTQVSPSVFCQLWMNSHFVLSYFCPLGAMLLQFVACSHRDFTKWSRGKKLQSARRAVQLACWCHFLPHVFFSGLFLSSTLAPKNKDSIDLSAGQGIKTTE